VAALALELLHCAIVGRQAGYPRLLLVLDLRPQGFPVLQSTQPLPLFCENQVFKLLDFFLAAIGFTLS